MSEHDPQVTGTPAYLCSGAVHIHGVPSRRLMIVLRTRGCEYARRTGGGCSVCGFLNHADEQITDADITAQLDGVLATTSLADIGELDLLTLGSFLNDNEISPTLRRSLLARIGGLEQFQRVSFESRAEYITAEKLAEGKALLGDRIVELGIGLESADDHVRNAIIKKGLSKRRFLKVVDLVAGAGMDLLVYLLIKPPGLSEAEAIADAVASARYVFEAARSAGIRARVAFEPVFICENTVLDDLYSASRYRLVNLWSVIDVIRQVHGEGEIFIGLSDETLSNKRLPDSCSSCNDQLIAAIEGYNGSQDIAAIEQLTCDCRAEYLAELERGTL